MGHDAGRVRRLSQRLAQPFRVLAAGYRVAGRARGDRSRLSGEDAKTRGTTPAVVAVRRATGVLARPRLARCAGPPAAAVGVRICPVRQDSSGAGSGGPHRIGVREQRLRHPGAAAPRVEAISEEWQEERPAVAPSCCTSDQHLLATLAVDGRAESVLSPASRLPSSSIGGPSRIRSRCAAAYGEASRSARR